MSRLLQNTRTNAGEAIDGDLKLTYQLAPPMLPGRDGQGRPVKRAFREGMEKFWPLLATMKRLRGTPFNPFGYIAEGRIERLLIRQYERDMGRILKDPTLNPEAALALAELPLQIRGFGPVKHANAEAAARRREEILAAFDSGSHPAAKTAA